MNLREITKLAEEFEMFAKFGGPSWVANEKLWDKAEKAVMKNKGKQKYKGDTFYKVVSHVYFNMGGKKKPKKD